MKRRDIFTTVRIVQAVIVIAAVLAGCGAQKNAEPLGLFGPSRLRHVLGQDGVAPVPFDEGLTLWTFGDTILGDWKGDVSASATFSERAMVKGMLHNSLAFTGALSEAAIGDPGFTFYREKGAVVPFLKNLPGEDPGRIRIWALDGIRLGDSVHVYYLKIRVDDPGKAMAFTPMGTGLAVWRVPAGWRKGDAVAFRRSDGLFRGDEPAFGGSVIEKDGYLYITGQQSTKDFKSYARIARVPVNEIASRRAYRFLAPGGAWTDDLGKSLALFGDVAGECTLSYNLEHRCFLIVYSKLWKGELALVKFRDFRELDAPLIRTVFTPPPLPEKDGKQEHFYYSGKEIYSSGGRVYAIYINPRDYQPYLVRIIP